MRFPKSPRRVFADAITRREALRYLAAAASVTMLPASNMGCGNDGGESTGGSPLQPEELEIETTIVVMMENRSFDHMFGAYSLLEGRPVDGLDARFANPDLGGTSIPIFRTGMRCIDDPPHSWGAGHRQVGAGTNDGFVREYETRLREEGADPQAAREVMGYLTRQELPIHYALADEFALYDRWFCSVLGPTWPNRFYLHSAQSNGQMKNDPPNSQGFQWATIYDRMDDAGIGWKSYFSDLPFLFLWGGLRRRSDRIRPIEEFFEDARAGTLPPLVHVEPSYRVNDDHPPHDIALGQAFLSAVINAVGQGPQWRRAMIVLCYDEHGGFYDHVVPPTVADERADLGFGQLGVRVPGLVISPYSRRGYVSSMLHEHSSVAAFVEWLYGLPPLTIRDANANRFVDSFDLRRVRNLDPRPFPQLPPVALDPDIPPECQRFSRSMRIEKTDLEMLADRVKFGADFDRRDHAVDIVQGVHRQLARFGGIIRPL